MGLVKGELLRRSSYDNYSAPITGSARWAFFAILIVLIIVSILATFRINKKRLQHGVQPMYGTRWMTPPSYGQSQNQYNQPHRRDPDVPSAYVPTYTATATDTDMGYYDAEGNFHPNPNANTSGVKAPAPTHQRHLSTTSNGAPINNRFNSTLTDEDSQQDLEIDDIFRPPTTAPPGRNTPTHNFMLRPTTEPSPDTSDEYKPPDGPPPHEDLPREGSSSHSDILPVFTEGSNPPQITEKQG